MASVEDEYGPELSLQEAAADGLPVVVRLCEDVKTNVGGYKQLDQGTEIYVQDFRSVEYVRMRILDVLDDEEYTKKYGNDFVPERQFCEDEEYLIPFSIPVKLRYVIRPKTRGRYVTIAQVGVERQKIGCNVIIKTSDKNMYVT